jgi:3-oxoacyl-[acyl-carrier-protein] synthase-1
MCFAEGHTGVARALAHARAEFEAGRADRALVISADSYLDSGSLDWLLAEDRLKSGDNPVGLAPGEAGAALLVETREACAARGGTPLAVLPLVTVLAAPSPNGERSARDDEDVAVRLAEVLGAATGAHSERFDGDLFVDLNGEVWKSRVWGSAQPRLHETIDWETARTVFPIVELGETGAATAAVSLCLGVRSFARRYARSDRALVCSIADDGAVAAIVLAGAD